MNKLDLSFRGFCKIIALIFFPLIVFSLALFPPIIFFNHFLALFNFSDILSVLLFSFFMIFNIYLLVISFTIIPGIIIMFLKKPKEGVYDFSLNDVNFFRFSMFNLIYRLPLMLIGIFRLPPLRNIYYKFAGLKIGKGSHVSGAEIIFDPYLIEIGKNSFIGGEVKITAHTIEDKFVVKRVRIGDDCLIGFNSFIMPGANIEDGVMVGSRSLIVKNQVLKKWNVYAGSPAHFVKKHKKQI